MLSRGTRNALFGAALMVGLGAHAARASDPLPADLIAPPPNLNIVLYYNEFADAGALEPAHGGGSDRNTHISVDVQALRYIRTFSVDGFLSGVQIVEPYTSFIGNQETGVQTPFGPGRASLSHGGGFAQPQLGAFIFPISNADTGTDLVTGVWLEPPIGNYQKDKFLNFTQNLWTGELEIGARKVLLGNAAGRNLAVEAWGEEYFYGDNGNAAIVSPQVSVGPIVVPASSTPARLSEQPTGELRIYFPYQFFPLTRAAIIPGFYQSFGGKQVYTLSNGARVDSGARTNETQLRLMVSSYITPHWQVLLNGEYDLAARGGPLERAVELRVATIF